MFVFSASAIGRSVGGLTFSADSQLLTVRDEKGLLFLHDVSSGEKLVSKNVGNNKCLGFWGGPNGRTFFAYSYHHGLIPLDADRKKELPVVEGSPELIEPAISPGGSRAVSKLGGFKGSSITGHTVSRDGAKKAWTRRPTDPVGKLSGVFPLFFLPDGDRFLVESTRVDGEHCNRLMLCRWSDKASRVSCDAPPGFTYARVSPDGTYLACASYDSPTVTVFDTADLTRPPEQHTLDGKRSIGIGGYHPSGDYLIAFGGQDVLFLDARTFRVMKTYDWEIGPVRSAAFSPDGALAAASGEKGKVVVWDGDV